LHVLKKIRSEFQAIKDGEPGRRFADHYERTRRREGGRGSAWRTSGYVFAGLVLLVSGFLLSLPPGVPGFLLWIPGLALLAARLKTLAIVLDRLERAARRAWQRVRTRGRR
jgi:hypothetical protein